MKPLICVFNYGLFHFSIYDMYQKCIYRMCKVNTYITLRVRFLCTETQREATGAKVYMNVVKIYMNNAGDDGR